MKNTTRFLSLLLSSLAFIEVTSAGAAGFYAGGGLGISRLDTSERALFNNKGWNNVENSTKRGGLGWQLFGGYNFNEYFGFQLGYNTYADSKYSSVASRPNTRLLASRKHTMNAFNILGIVSFPIGDTGFNVYGLGGGAQMNGRAASTVGTYSNSSSQQKFRPMYGAGVGYAFSEQFSTKLELSRIQGDGNQSIASFPNADALTLNLAYHFN